MIVLYHVLFPKLNATCRQLALPASTAMRTANASSSTQRQPLVLGRVCVALISECHSWPSSRVRGSYVPASRVAQQVALRALGFGVKKADVADLLARHGEESTQQLDFQVWCWRFEGFS